jgi:acetone carboxylase gamma subunit
LEYGEMSKKIKDIKDMTLRDRKRYYKSLLVLAYHRGVDDNFLLPLHDYLIDVENFIEEQVQAAKAAKPHRHLRLVKE